MPTVTTTSLRVGAKKKSREVYNINALKAQDTRREFTIELSNRFAALTSTEDDSVESEWNKIKESYCETSRKVLGYRKKKVKEWISAKTWQKIDDRKKAKQKLLSAKSPRLKELAGKDYKAKDKEVKRSARNDKRTYIEDLATQAEVAAEQGRLSTVYKITKQLCTKPSRQSVPVRDKSGNLITTEAEQALRWVQHFQKSSTKSHQNRQQTHHHQGTCSMWT
jgi:hypothetical protein